MYAQIYVNANEPDALLSYLKTIDDFDPNSQSAVAALWTAFEERFFDVQDVLMKQGVADAEFRDQEGNHPIHILAVGGNTSVSICRKNGIPVDLLNKDGETPLSLAKLYQRKEIEEYLVREGADEELAKKIAGSRTVQEVLKPQNSTTKCYCNLL